MINREFLFNIIVRPGLNIPLFDKLSKEDAQKLLLCYLEAENEIMPELIKKMSQEGIIVDYSLESLPIVLEWLSKHVIIHVSQSENPYIGQMIEFDKSAFPYLWGGSYYWGETMIKAFPKLKWSIGERKYMQKNQPVVAGFPYKQELTTFNNIKVMFSRVILKETNPVTKTPPEKEIARGCKIWADKMR